MKIRIVLADDHPVLVAGVAHVLSNVPSLEVVGTAQNSTEVVELLGREPCDILVTDYAMPGGDHGDGMVFLSFLCRRFPNLKIIVFTMIENPAIVREVAKLGVAAVVNKRGKIDELVSAIHTVCRGGRHYPAQPVGESTPGPGEPARPMLSKREAEVVRLYVSGLSINEIAEQLHRTKQTVSTQKVSAMRKLGIVKDADLFRFAFEAGMDGSAPSDNSAPPTETPPVR